MKVERQAEAKERRASEARRASSVLVVVLPSGIAGYVCFARFYLVREWLVVAALTALLVFFAANLALLGIVVHAAGRMMLEFVRKAQPSIVVGEAVPVGCDSDAFGHSSTIGTAAQWHHVS